MEAFEEVKEKQPQNSFQIQNSELQYQEEGEGS